MQPQTLAMVMVHRTKGSKVQRAQRRCNSKSARRLQIMRTSGTTGKDTTHGGGVQHKAHYMVMRKCVLPRCSACFVVKCSTRFYRAVAAVDRTPTIIKVRLSNEPDDVCNNLPDKCRGTPPDSTTNLTLQQRIRQLFWRRWW
jgi:hypothetical protein